MPGGVSFNGAVEFRSALLTYREALLRTLTEKLLTFAIGRGVEHDDMPEVRRIVSEAAPAGHRWSALIIGVVKSAPFSMRRSAQ